MFNLYSNATSSDSFLSLVSKNTISNNDDFKMSSQRIVSGFAVVSLLILSVIVNGSQYQTSVEAQKLTTLASYSSVI